MIVPVINPQRLGQIAGPRTFSVLKRWLAQGKGVGIYQVTDPGRANIGQYSFYSYVTRPSAPLGVEYQLIGLVPPSSL